MPQFSEAIQNGNAHRIEQSQEEIKLLLSFKKYVDTYNNYIHHKDVKKRVTHHDTKISNVLFNKIDGQEQAICVIDLDTTMFQMTNTMGCYGMTPNTITQI